MDPQEVAKIKAFVKKERPMALTLEEKVDILRLHAGLRDDGIANVATKIAKWLGRGQGIVKAVLREYRYTGSLKVAKTPSNTTNHASRVPNTPEVRALVKKFIRDRSVTRTRKVAKDVLGLLRAKDKVQIKKNNSKDYDDKDYNACLRAVQAFVGKQGYKRGKRDGKSRFSMVPVVKEARRPIVYLDESFIHHHYPRHLDSLYDPTDTKETKAKHKGRRYCFIAGILHDGTDFSHLVGLHIFEGGKKNGKTIKDYHATFNHDYFVAWFDHLIKEVESLGYTEVVFVMDNAKYHKGKPTATPKGTWKKRELFQACMNYGFQNITMNDLKSTMWARVQVHVAQHVLPVVVDMARARGHDVVYTVPYFSELQPIEMIWANVKGKVGRAYTSDTSFSQVLQRLDDAFWSLDGGTIHDTIENSTAYLFALDKKLVQRKQQTPFVETPTTTRTWTRPPVKTTKKTKAMMTSDGPTE
ncbi:hypothetical protein ACHHYP_02185 [Achlya hypogyna]|uniref:Uncharacterized protein n=1 Tax=Achlya hypogyna TaxID=1202772 RepID=A0A1V9ZS92_ACHHY|nr:hypothetical protein ACHHYP_02185 [Achlya hypogyna]